jgi:peptidoglycan/xylan/chitin deacetylase (PgdA/CDA1 family)
MYHRIAADGPPELKRYRTTPEALDRQLTMLRREGFHAITLDEWRWHLLTRNPLPGRPVMITFDDGYRDVLTDAWPILRRHGMTATVFVVADTVGTVAVWDAGHGDPASLLSRDEIRVLRDQGVSFGAHGASHRRLTGLLAEDLVNEGIRSRVMLESCLEERVATLAYPYGDQDGAVRSAMRDCGYDVGFSIVHGIADIWANPMRVPRIEVTGFDTLDAFAAKLGIVPTTCSRQVQPTLSAK